jgi:hypothetical protein
MTLSDVLEHSIMEQTTLSIKNTYMNLYRGIMDQGIIRLVR